MMIYRLRGLPSESASKVIWIRRQLHFLTQGYHFVSVSGDMFSVLYIELLDIIFSREGSKSPMESLGPLKAAQWQILGKRCLFK
jgi:hypothetical protein